jgi:hypothetical protein
MARTSEFTQALEDTLDEIKGYRERADKARPIRFGQERLSSPKYVSNRIQSMNENERSEFLSQHGTQKMLEMLRSGRPSRGQNV